MSDHGHLASATGHAPDPRPIGRGVWTFPRSIPALEASERTPLTRARSVPFAVRRSLVDDAGDAVPAPGGHAKAARLKRPCARSPSPSPSHVFLTLDSFSAVQAGPHTITVAPIVTPSNDLCSSPPLPRHARQRHLLRRRQRLDAQRLLRLRLLPLHSARGLLLLHAFHLRHLRLQRDQQLRCRHVGRHGLRRLLHRFTDQPEQLILTLTVGQTYFFVVEPYSGATTFTVAVN